MVSCAARIDVAKTQVYGSLTIGGVLMHRKAWAIIDVTPLWLPADQVGEDLFIPGKTDGRIALPRFKEVTERELPMVIDGRFSPTDTENANELKGLKDNIAYLNTYVVSPTGGDGTRLFSLTPPGGGTPDTGYAHVTHLEPGGKLGAMMTAVLTVSFPGGEM